MIGRSAFLGHFFDHFSNFSINFSDQKHRLVEPIRDELIVNRFPLTGSRSTVRMAWAAWATMKDRESTLWRHKMGHREIRFLGDDKRP